VRSLHQHIRKKAIRLLFKISSFCFFLCLSTISFAQNEQLNFIDNTAIEIIYEIESKTDFVFTFLPTSLPDGKFSFSLLLDPVEIDKQLESVFQRKISISDASIIIAPEKANQSFETTQIILNHTLVEASSKEPIIGANVYIQATSQGTATDENGHFNIQGYFIDTDMVEITYLGYETILTEVGKIKNQKEISLVPKKHILDDIVIRTGKKLVNTTLLSETIDPSKIELPSADKDVFTMAQMVPGVYNSGESLDDLQIRGGPPDQVSFNWNNIQLYQNSMFYGRVSAVNPFMVDQINITRNGASADEQASSSGAINMSTDFSAYDKSGIKMHINALYANVGAHAVLFDGKLKLKGAMRRSFSPTFKSPIHDRYFTNSFQYGKLPDIEYFADLFEITELITLTPTLQFGDRSFSAEYSPTGNTTISFNHLKFNNEFTYKQEKDYTEEVEFDSLSSVTNGYSIEWEQSYSKYLSSNISYSSTDYDYGYLSTNDNTDPNAEFLTQENGVAQKTVRAGLKWESKSFDVSVGYNYSDWNVFYRATATRLNEQYYNDEEIGLGNEHSQFANLSLCTHPWYKIILGVRRSAFNESLFGRKIIEPRLHASIFATNNLTFHAHYGKFHQNLNRRAISNPLNVDKGIWFLSDESIPIDNFIHIVQSEQLSFGANYMINKWNIKTDIYKKKAFDVWTSAFDFTSTEDLYEFSDLDIKGAEVAINYVSEKWSTAFTYDYVNDQIETKNSNTKLPSPYSQPHRISLFGNWKLGDFDLSSQLNFATGRKYSVPTSLEIIDYGDGGEYVAIFDDYFTENVPNYIRWDAGVRYNFKIPLVKKSSISLQLINILNRQNTIKTFYFVSYREDPPEIDFYQQRGLPLVWNISLDLEF